MPRGRRATIFAESTLALLIALGGASSPRAMEVRAKGELPCKSLAALGPAIDQRLGPDAATSEAGLRLRIQGRSGDRIYLSLVGAGRQVLFDRTVQAESLSCEDLVASLSLLASIWIRQTSSLASDSHATRPGNLAPARHAARKVDAGLPIEVPDAGSEPAAVDAGPVDDAGSNTEVDAGAETVVDAGAIEVPDAGEPTPPATVNASLEATNPWRWGVHLGAAVTGGVGVGDDGTIAPYVVGLRLDGALYGPLRLELAGTYMGAFTDKLSPGQVQVQQGELILRIAVAPLRTLPHLYFLAGPALDILATSTSGYATNGSHPLFNGGGQIGARWEFAFTERFSLQVGLIAELRGYRDALVVTRTGGSNLTVGTVPPFWVLPEIGLHGDAL